MLNKFAAIYLLAAIAVSESKDNIVAIHDDRDEARQLRGIANNLMLVQNTSESDMRTRTDDTQAIDISEHADAAALQQVEAYANEPGKTKFKEQLAEFWKKSSEKVADVDTHNGYVSGVLLVIDPSAETLGNYEDIGGVGLVYLSWAGLAIGAADNVDKINNINAMLWALAENQTCSSKLLQEGAGLTVNVIGQGLGLASILGAGPAGGAVFGLASAALAFTSEKMMKNWQELRKQNETLDLLDSNCDDWLSNYQKTDKKENSVTITSTGKKIPDLFELQKNVNSAKNKKAMIQKFKDDDWTEEIAKDVKKMSENDWYDPSKTPKNKVNDKKKQTQKKKIKTKKQIEEENKIKEKKWVTYFSASPIDNKSIDLRNKNDFSVGHPKS